jgi:CHAT domain-containing protein
LDGVGAPSSDDLADVVAAYPEGAARLVIGADAGPRALAQWFGRVRVAQVMAHGSLDERRARPVGMLLAGDDPAAVVFVGADELERTDAPPLVVLTVCGAGATPKRRGDAGAADLAGALFAAGERSRCVVQSSYDLDVESARRISTAFHRALVRGASPAEALRSARADLARDERFADPFHHASITVVGLGHEPLFVP